MGTDPQGESGTSYNHTVMTLSEGMQMKSTLALPDLSVRYIA